MVSFNVSKNEAGQRLDKLLMKTLNKAPASFIYKMLRKKNITLNGKKADGSEKTVAGDEIKLFLSDETLAGFSDRDFSASVSTGPRTDSASKASEQTGAAKGLSDAGEKVAGAIPPLKPELIVYEDDDIIVVNKPLGVLSQKAAPTDISINETIVEYLKGKGIGVNEAFTPGVCNRIDRNTSGLIIAGKSMPGLQDMAELLKSHEVEKYYLCIVWGHMYRPKHIKAYFLKDAEKNKVAISETAKEGYEEIEAEYIPILNSIDCELGDFALLAVKLITGKPHQIRAHLGSLNHPLVGDSKYGYRNITGINAKYQQLHSFMLIFPKDTLRLTGISGKKLYCMPGTTFKNTCSKLFGDEGYKHAIMEFQRSKGFRAGGTH